MTELDRDSLRKLAEWTSNGYPVSSFYLDVDGRRFPRRQDVEQRAEEISHQLLEQAHALERDARRSVEEDRARILGFFRDLDRGAVRGAALFSCSAGGLWEEILLPRAVEDRAAVGDHPHVLPLEAMLETYESFCTAIVDREKARILLARMGRIEENSDVLDEVPGRHDQGGWAQARFQRHIDDHVGRHLRHVADVLLRFFKRRGFDHLVLAGPEEVVPELERVLHDYVRRRVVARIPLPMTATASEVLARSMEIEERLELDRERETLDRLHAEAAAGRNAVIGLGPVLEALNDGRVATLVVPPGLDLRGLRCTSCGRLWADGDGCPVCGGSVERVPDVVESAVAAALRQSARVETIARAGPESQNSSHELGALLRY